jgi:inorganic triphosphatase YgiF
VSEPVERELKLVPADPALLDRLAAVKQLGGFVATGAHRESQHNSFYDSATRSLGKARVGFRRRTVAGQSLATWTIKSESQRATTPGIATRAEIELRLDAEMPPALAIGALRDAARARGAPALADDVSDALAAGGLPLATPYLETETDRRVVDLEAEDGRSAVELALDRVRLIGHAVEEIEIEAELKRGDEADLEEIRLAIAASGDVRESEGSKLSRALSHLDVCHCADSAP